MADEQVEQIDPYAEGIPHVNVRVSQLKFWLKCRRKNQSGNKKELLEGKLVHLRLLVILRSLNCSAGLVMTS